MKGPNQWRLQLRAVDHQPGAKVAYGFGVIVDQEDRIAWAVILIQTSHVAYYQGAIKNAKDRGDPLALPLVSVTKRQRLLVVDDTDGDLLKTLMADDRRDR